MTLYALHTQEGDTLKRVASNVEAGSPEDAGRKYVRSKFGDAPPPEEQNFIAIVESAITEVKVRAKNVTTLEVTSNREIRKRAKDEQPDPEPVGA